MACGEPGWYENMVYNIIPPAKEVGFPSAIPSSWSASSSQGSVTEKVLPFPNSLPALKCCVCGKEMSVCTVETETIYQSPQTFLGKLVVETMPLGYMYVLKYSCQCKTEITVKIRAENMCKTFTWGEEDFDKISEEDLKLL